MYAFEAAYYKKKKKTQTNVMVHVTTVIAMQVQCKIKTLEQHWENK